jgi:diguanylate cyclase (GGDEF)-like protein
VFADLATSSLTLAEERGLAADRTEALEYRATHDALTGLPNRGLLMDRLEHALLADTRRVGVVAVMFVDVDSLKELNDDLGHHVGDIALTCLAQRLTATLRAGDTVGRLGGDEFLIICEHLTGPPPAVERRLRALGDRLLSRLAIPRPDQLDVVVSVSIGVAIGGRTPDAQELIRTADHAMYRAKARGGGQLAIADSSVLPRIEPLMRQPLGVPRKRSSSRGAWTEAAARVPTAEPGT